MGFGKTFVHSKNSEYINTIKVFFMCIPGNILVNYFIVRIYLIDLFFKSRISKEVS